MGDTSFFESIRYRYDTNVVSIPVSLRMVLDHSVENSIWNTIDDFSFIQFHQTYFQKKKFAFFSFFLLWLTFYWSFHTYMLTKNRAGSVSKTSDTWWKYRYLTLTCKYRQYRYSVSVSCPSLHPYPPPPINNLAYQKPVLLPLEDTQVATSLLQSLN